MFVFFAFRQEFILRATEAKFDFRQNKGSYLESIVEANTKRKIMV